MTNIKVQIILILMSYVFISSVKITYIINTIQLVN